MSVCDSTRSMAKELHFDVARYDLTNSTIRNHVHIHRDLVWLLACHDFIVRVFVGVELACKSLADESCASSVLLYTLALYTAPNDGV